MTDDRRDDEPARARGKDPDADLPREMMVTPIFAEIPGRGRFTAPCWRAEAGDVRAIAREAGVGTVKLAPGATTAELLRELENLEVKVSAARWVLIARALRKLTTTVRRLGDGDLAGASVRRQAQPRDDAEEAGTVGQGVGVSVEYELSRLSSIPHRINFARARLTKVVVGPHRAQRDQAEGPYDASSSRCSMRRRGFGLRLQIMKKSALVSARPAFNKANWIAAPAALPSLS
jgi:hypothetical protein